MGEVNISREKLMEIIALQTEVVQQGMDLGRIMNLVTSSTQFITQADGACIELIQDQELVYSAASGMAERFLGLRLNMKNSLSGECIKSRKLLFSNDIELDDRVDKAACRLIGLKSMIVVPFVCIDEVVGVLKVLSSRVAHFTNEHAQILELVADLIAATMFNAMRNEESELFHKATHDFLTGIPNRSLFYDRIRQILSQAVRKKESFGVIMVDMDGLKGINDNLGHSAGDVAIKEVALRIKQVIRHSDMVARLGGDEFGIIVANAKEYNDIIWLIERMENEIEKPFEFEGQIINLSASMGYAFFTEPGTDVENLIEIADQSMYAVKRERKKLKNICKERD